MLQLLDLYMRVHTVHVCIYIQLHIYVGLLSISIFNVYIYLPGIEFVLALPSHGTELLDKQFFVIWHNGRVK